MRRPWRAAIAMAPRPERTDPVRCHTPCHRIPHPGGFPGRRGWRGGDGWVGPQGQGERPLDPIRIDACAPSPRQRRGAAQALGRAAGGVGDPHGVQHRGSGGRRGLSRGNLVRRDGIGTPSCRPRNVLHERDCPTSATRQQVFLPAGPTRNGSHGRDRPTSAAPAARGPPGTDPALSTHARWVAAGWRAPMASAMERGRRSRGRLTSAPIATKMTCMRGEIGMAAARGHR